MSEKQSTLPHQEEDKEDTKGALAPGMDMLIDEHEEEVSENGKTVRHKGIFLLPNLITTAGLFCGFYAIVASIQGRFEGAAIAIFFAAIFDGLDGRVARLTNTSSKFGEEYDSLADMVSFGVAPALVMYSWGLSDLGKIEEQGEKEEQQGEERDEEDEEHEEDEEDEEGDH